MKKCQTLFLFVSIVFTASKLFAQAPALTTYKFQFQNELKAWVNSFPKFLLKDFKFDRMYGFADTKQDSSGLQALYSIYKPALTFSPDRNQFIDIYSSCLDLEKEGKRIVSYGYEVDQQIDLWDLKKNSRMRISFFGSTELIQEAVWINDSMFIMTGVIWFDSHKANPVIYIGNTNTRKFIEYKCTNTNCIQSKRGFNSPKLVRMRIIKKYI